MTELEKRCVKALKEWYPKFKKPYTGYAVKSVSHVHCRAYVIGKAAAACLIVAYPVDDAAPQIKELKKIMDSDGVSIIHSFDKSLKMGDWCTIGYVVTNGVQETIAIPMVK